MNSRISLLIRAKNISPAQLADEIGVQRSGISHILNGRNKPSLDFIQRIIRKYPDVSMNWLLFGEGPMMNPYPNADNPVIDNKPSKQTNFMELFADEIKGDENKSIPDELNEQIFDDYSTDNKIDSTQETVQNFRQENSRKSLDATEEKETPKKDQEPVVNMLHRQKNKRISRIVIFYNDKTFSEHFPEED